MILGAVAVGVYSFLVCQHMRTPRPAAGSNGDARPWRSSPRRSRSPGIVRSGLRWRLHGVTRRLPPDVVDAPIVSPVLLRGNCHACEAACVREPEIARSAGWLVPSRAWSRAHESRSSFEHISTRRTRSALITSRTDEAATGATHGAACHGCLLIAETSCESRNQFLDRALLARTMRASDAAFLSAPISAGQTEAAPRGILGMR